jgi:hypothetical protein
VDIVQVIRGIIREFGLPATEINAGFCEEFADRVAEKLPGAVVVWDWEADEAEGMNRGWAWAHCFVRYEGKFYDAECPHGVEHWLNLPFFLGKTPDCNKFVEDYDE